MTDRVALDLGAEADLFTAARVRIGSGSGSALIDETGRIYSAADVWLPHLRLSAIELAVATAAAGARSLASCVVVGATGQLAATDRAAIADPAASAATITAYRPDRSIVANWSAS